MSDDEDDSLFIKHKISELQEGGSGGSDSKEKEEDTELTYSSQLVSENDLIEVSDDDEQDEDEDD